MSQSIADAIREAATLLRRSGVPQARREALSLLTPVLQKEQAFVITHADDLIAADALSVYQHWTTRRAGGEPLQYITGHQEFFGLDFEVSPAVLIPRRETELLVETVLELSGETKAAPLICDIGTGSGCIIISLLYERRNAHGFAVDISPAAALIARRNAARAQIGERLSLVVADGFTAFRSSDVKFDFVVSNPPYIAARDFPDLQREVREHEPQVALTSGEDGLTMIRRLINDAPQFLAAGGYLVLEIGYDQRAAVEQLVNQRVWRIVVVRNDLQGIPRTVALQKLPV
jgi:release factor glutamine methyltransferase